MEQPTGAQIMQGFIPSSPFVQTTGIELVSLDTDEATLRLPFRDANITIGTVVHGGAVSSLIDTAAMAAAWSGAEVPENLRGTTVSLSVSFLAAADGCDLVARARVLRRGSSLQYVEVDVADPDGRAIAKGLVTYKIG